MSNGQSDERADEGWAANLGDALIADLVEPDELEVTLGDVKRRARQEVRVVSDSSQDSALVGDLSITVRMIGDITIVEISGELDIYTLDRFVAAIKDLVDHGRKYLILDVDGLDFLDSSGLGPMVGASKRAKAYGGFLLVVCDEIRIMKIFRITGLTRALPFFPSVEAALSAAEGKLAP
ncbi:STAS domain-containing protein [Streptomyces sp. enrichment culture]|uniref:STAS domain-containing protein n=1 Tax=Streptomyces sp. enrichment culture TaxID=1795815 RepID=UPI003F5566F1